MQQNNLSIYKTKILSTRQHSETTSNYLFIIFQNVEDIYRLLSVQ